MLPQRRCGCLTQMRRSTHTAPACRGRGQRGGTPRRPASGYAGGAPLCLPPPSSSPRGRIAQRIRTRGAGAYRSPVPLRVLLLQGRPQSPSPGPSSSSQTPSASSVLPPDARPSESQLRSTPSTASCHSPDPQPHLGVTSHLSPPHDSCVPQNAPHTVVGEGTAEHHESTAAFTPGLYRVKPPFGLGPETVVASNASLYGYQPFFTKQEPSATDSHGEAPAQEASTLDDGPCSTPRAHEHVPPAVFPPDTINWARLSQEEKDKFSPIVLVPQCDISRSPKGVESLVHIDNSGAVHDAPRETSPSAGRACCPCDPPVLERQDASPSLSSRNIPGSYRESGELRAVSATLQGSVHGGLGARGSHSMHVVGGVNTFAGLPPCVADSAEFPATSSVAIFFPSQRVRTSIHEQPCAVREAPACSAVCLGTMSHETMKGWASFQHLMAKSEQAVIARNATASRTYSTLAPYVHGFAERLGKDGGEVAKIVGQSIIDGLNKSITCMNTHFGQRLQPIPSDDLNAYCIFDFYATALHVRDITPSVPFPLCLFVNGALHPLLTAALTHMTPQATVTWALQRVKSPLWWVFFQYFEQMLAAGAAATLHRWYEHSAPWDMLGPAEPSLWLF